MSRVATVCGALYAGGWRLAARLGERHRRWVDSPACRRQRWGVIEWPPAVEEAPGRIWLHGASVGEVASLAPVVEALRQRCPDRALVVSGSTPAGVAAAGRLAVDHAFAQPFDFVPPLEVALQSLSPELLLIVETEVWPGLIGQATALGVPVAFLNARLTASSTRAYRFVRRWLQPLFGGVGAVAAQDDASAGRFIDLGVSSDRVRVVGSTKFDALPEWHDAPRPTLAPRRQWVVAGSIRRLEEDLVLDAWRRLEHPPAPGFDRGLVIAPRHLERARPLLAKVERRGWRVRCRSAWTQASCAAAMQAAAHNGVQVLILDTHGELTEAYAGGVAAVVGGGFAEAKGHNVAEPAALGRPVVFGYRHRPIAGELEALVEAGAGRGCRDAAAVADTMGAWLADGQLETRGRRARQVVTALRGATERSLDFVTTCLARDRRSPVDPRPLEMRR